MSCWRVLKLSDQLEGDQPPQLLIKPRFDLDAYTIFLTDLSNIWSEELSLAGIVGRASEEESPIEVSKQDTAQLAILLKNVQSSLVSNDDTSRHMTQDGADGIILHTTISLPEPLDSLRWKFHLVKRTAATLKDELILPLLVSSHIQHSRLNGLISTIAEKDRAITRLVDQYESSNLDLAAAFPSITNLKSGRRLVKLEQAARHVPGLQAFDEDSWKRDTAELHDTNVSTLGLFQEALSECTPKVPPRLLSENESNEWWTKIGTTVNITKPNSKSKHKAKAIKSEPLPSQIVADSEAEEDETEDEFEVHENFKSRHIAKQTAHALKPTPLPPTKPPVAADGGTTDEDEDDDDLDAPPKSQSQTRTQRKASPRAELATPEPSTPPKARTPSPPIASPPPKEKSHLTQKPKSKGFRIGGKAKKSESPAPLSKEAREIPSTEKSEDAACIPSRPKADSEALAGTKTARKGFKIGGKGKAPVENKDAGRTSSSPHKNWDVSTAVRSPSMEPSAAVSTRAKKEATPIEDNREETTEERAERKRRELKRKNEEAAKKQAQSKKKKRF